jgi:hypothetical protein
MKKVWNSLFFIAKGELLYYAILAAVTLGAYLIRQAS